MKCRSRFNSWTDRTRFIDMSEWMTTLHPVIHPGSVSFELNRGQRKFLPSIGIAMTVESSSSNSVSDRPVSVAETVGAN